MTLSGVRLHLHLAQVQVFVKHSWAVFVARPSTNKTTNARMDTPVFVYSCKFVDGFPDPEGAFKRLLEGLESLKK